MHPWRVLALFTTSAAVVWANQPASAAGIADELNRITLDSAATFRVRDLQLRRGDVTFYFTDGLLAFASEVNGRRTAAIFVTSGVDAGDAEVLVLPPQAAERQSFSSFAGAPNLDEHFTSAILYFTDRTADELLTQIGKMDPLKTPAIDPELRSEGVRILRHASAQVRTRMVAAILDPGKAQNGLFYAAIDGRGVGAFDIAYDPNSSEPVTVGRTVAPRDQPRHFELWTNYRPRNARPYRPPGPDISHYSIDVTVQPDLSLSAAATFELAPHADFGRVVSLSLSRRMRVQSATIDGEPVEVFQQVDEVSNSFNSDAEFLLVLAHGLNASSSHRVEIRYAGSIISQLPGSSYLVGERNLWYPHTETMLTDFDLHFHCPDQLDIVSTGALVDEKIENGMRTVHRRTASPQQMAGFNLGEYQKESEESPPYQIESYREKALQGNFNRIPELSAEILRHYTAEWLALPDRNLAITPIPGDFGQGFPGLIYLSKTAYLPESQRPLLERGKQETIFFSNLLLPHEIAHQWWGNLVTPDSYRSDWIMEAMANESALEFIAGSGGAAIREAVLEQYRTDLRQLLNGKSIEASGPVDFGVRITTTAGFPAWQTVVYKKGTWILRMLRARMGDANFVRMQAKLLRTYAGKAISNEDFRKIASGYIPAGQPDPDLQLFFDTWVYGTGIPKLTLNRAGTILRVGGVDAVFAADVPLPCKTKGGPEQLRWLRIEAGENAVPVSGCKLPSRLDFLYLPG